ncbi:uncharacterized protein METZ01_LOCUS32694 [marine metagenome]|uniref:Uncharacterized protein n=1 Tax=marine metagenome TaxID=408172 RepID=A0A381QLC2_9ZZZZ
MVSHQKIKTAAQARKYTKQHYYDEKI